VLLFPGALADRAEDLGKAYVGSLSLFAGQFCTNPGLVIALDSPDLDRFLSSAAQALAGVAPQVMLTGAIAAAYAKGIATLTADEGVSIVAAGPDGARRAPRACSPSMPRICWPTRR
jgi:NADP-dependent aldehyde dehydrogenase